jgi:hypothetical protein
VEQRFASQSQIRGAAVVKTFGPLQNPFFSFVGGYAAFDSGHLATTPVVLALPIRHYLAQFCMRAMQYNVPSFVFCDFAWLARVKMILSRSAM